ncbi:MAG: type II toxin-antitoxin system RelE/ParE family toxin [Sphingomonadaceae bacterium]
MKLAWSRLARDELRALRDYSIEHWGRAVALRYLEDVRDAAKRLAANPRMARQLRGRLRIARVRSHYLIVDVDEDADRLTVARVLHTAMDIERHLP